MRNTAYKLLAAALNSLVCLQILMPKAFSQTATNSDYLRNFQVSLTSFAGSGNAEAVGRVKQSSGFDVAAEKPFQLSKRWIIGPYLKGGVHSARITGEISPAARLGTTLDIKAASVGGSLGYIVPVPMERLPVIFMKGGAGILQAKALVDRSEPDHFAQASYGDLKGQIKSFSSGVLLPLSEAFHVELAAALIQYSISTSGTSSTDVEEIREGTTLRFTKEETPQATGLPETIQLKTQALSIGLGVAF